MVRAIETVELMAGCVKDAVVIACALIPSSPFISVPLSVRLMDIDLNGKVVPEAIVVEPY